jgi:biopolymer transport protein TolR
MPRRKQKTQLISELNVVPYIDVMLVLLVIFMITGPMMTQGIKLELPNNDHNEIEASDDTKNWVISINQQGEYFLENSNESNADTIENILVELLKEKENKAVNVYIRADKNTRYDYVVQLIASLKKHKINNVGLITEDEQ